MSLPHKSGSRSYSTCIMTMERSQELYQPHPPSDKSREGGSGGVTSHQVACRFHLLYFRGQTTGSRGQEAHHWSENMVSYKDEVKGNTVADVHRNLDESANLVAYTGEVTGSVWSLSPFPRFPSINVDPPRAPHSPPDCVQHLAV